MRAAPLPRTRAALAALDAHDATHPTDGAAWLARRDELEAAVVEAFVADTRAFNREDVARAAVSHSGGLQWLREICAPWTERAAGLPTYHRAELDAGQCGVDAIPFMTAEETTEACSVLASVPRVPRA